MTPPVTEAVQDPPVSDVSPAPVLLEVRDLRVRFELGSGPLEVVDGISFTLRRNEILCVVGESGSGKTVMMHSILGLVDVEPGTVGGQIVTHFEGKMQDLLEGLPAYLTRKTVGGREVVRRRPGWERLMRKRTSTLLGRHLGLIFQNPRNALDPLMTIGTQILESVRTARPELPAAEARAEAIGWLERVRINHPAEVFNLYPHQLSGGMCQRVAIAQILALRPDILIADEPTTGLDATIQVGILDLIKEVQREYGISVLLITHDFGVVERLADRILVLFRGRLLEYGDAEEILGRNARLHPYTSELLRNVRVLEGAGGAEQIAEVGRRARRPKAPRIDGVPGCNFLPLCPVAAQGGPELVARCQGETPGFVALSSSHHVRCHVAERLEPETL
jgi:ABC-type dipeptide/oligopeptide/nickel transport system ATPase component